MECGGRKAPPATPTNRSLDAKATSSRKRKWSRTVLLVPHMRVRTLAQIGSCPNLCAKTKHQPILHASHDAARRYHNKDARYG